MNIKYYVKQSIADSPKRREDSPKRAARSKVNDSLRKKGQAPRERIVSIDGKLQIIRK